MKHAFMIMAHNEWSIVQKLIDLLDDERNDIFLHIDKKVKTYPQLTAKKATVRYVPNELRVNNQYRKYTAVVAELTLLDYAVSFGPYLYYHLISGVDLPIKSNNDIHKFFEENKGGGRNFVGFALNNCAERMQKYHLFFPSSRKRTLCNILRNYLYKVTLHMQRALHITRNSDIQIRKGEVWVSITDAFAKYCLSRRGDILHRIKHTIFVDELLWQTLIWNSPYRSTIYNLSSEHEGCMREIDWQCGGPYVWGQDTNDFERLKHSNKLFARKFSSQYPQIIEEVYSYVNSLNDQVSHPKAK